MEKKKIKVTHKQLKIIFNTEVENYNTTRFYGTTVFNNMTFNDFIENPQSKKITIVEIDTPLTGYTWLNLQPGIWYTQLSPGVQTFTDDFGNVGFWSPANSLYYNIQSMNDRQQTDLCCVSDGATDALNIL